MGNKEQTLSFVENWGHKTAAKKVVGRRIDYVLISSSKRIKMLGVGLLAPIKSPVVLKNSNSGSRHAKIYASKNV